MGPKIMKTLASCKGGLPNIKYELKESVETQHKKPRYLAIICGTPSSEVYQELEVAVIVKVSFL